MKTPLSVKTLTPHKHGSRKSESESEMRKDLKGSGRVPIKLLS
jgi:hypothetical protein